MSATGLSNAVTPELEALRASDPSLAEALTGEIDRQQDQLLCIASENLAPAMVRYLNGSVFTDKYAEGYPGKRYYGGCEHVDTVEQLAIDRAKALFGAEHANVQPHSGSSANMGVYFSFLQPGDTILAMNLDHGGHLTHGHPLNFSGKLYNIVPYGVSRESETIDYDALQAQAAECRPKLIVAGASAYPRHFDFERLAVIAAGVDAALMVDMAHIAGLVAAGVHPNPVPHADFVTSTTHKTLRGPRGGLVLSRAEHAKSLDRTVFPGLQGGPLMHIIAAKAWCFGAAAGSDFQHYQQQVVQNAKVLAGFLAELGHRIVSGGTDNHLMLVDVTAVGSTGSAAELACDKAGIVLNKNMIPFDERSPRDPSGVRIGTPALTTRGMGKSEMRLVAQYFDDAVRHADDDAYLAGLRAKTRDLARDFPL
ncbi:MAG: serine hydroxymethyltransferase [Planctomycetota bacterium]|jgi:glycine hydroxymethyltransferase